MSFARRYYPWCVHVAVAMVSLYLCIRFRDQFPNLGGAVTVAGGVLIFSGIAIVFWAALHIRQGLLPRIDPALDHLVTTGPYRFVRHPVYLAFSIGIIGIALFLRSLIGIVAIAVLFVPIEIWRSHLEERELMKKFGDVYPEYRRRVPFMLPGWIRGD